MPALPKWVCELVREIRDDWGDFMSAWKPGTILAWGAILAWTLAGLWYGVFSSEVIKQIGVFVAIGLTMFLLIFLTWMVARKTFHRTTARFKTEVHWGFGVLTLVMLVVDYLAAKQVTDAVLAGWRDGLAYLAFTAWLVFAINQWRLQRKTKSSAPAETRRTTSQTSDMSGLDRLMATPLH